MNITWVVLNPVNSFNHIMPHCRQPLFPKIGGLGFVSMGVMSEPDPSYARSAVVLGIFGFGGECLP